MHKQLQVQYHKISTLLGLCIYIFAAFQKEMHVYVRDTDFVLLRWTENFKTRIEGREGKCGGRLGNPWISALAPQLNAGGLRKTKKKTRRSKIIAQLPPLYSCSKRGTRSIFCPCSPPGRCRGFLPGLARAPRQGAEREGCRCRKRTCFRAWLSVDSIWLVPIGRNGDGGNVWFLTAFTA